MKLEELKSKKIEKIKFGIVQGRLTQSPKGVIQCFPKNWEEEFLIASKLGLDNIELIADREYNVHNPIWSFEGIEKLKTLTELTINVSHRRKSNEEIQNVMNNFF